MVSEAEQETQQQQQQQPVKQVSYLMFLTNLRGMFTLIACTLVMIFCNFLDCIISVRLNKNFDLSEDIVGYVFVIPFLMYIIGCSVVTAISDRLERRVTIFLGFIIQMVGMIMTGPSLMLNLPE